MSTLKQQSCIFDVLLALRASFIVGISRILFSFLVFLFDPMVISMDAEEKKVESF